MAHFCREVLSEPTSGTSWEELSGRTHYFSFLTPHLQRYTIFAIREGAIWCRVILSLVGSQLVAYPLFHAMTVSSNWAFWMSVVSNVNLLLSGCIAASALRTSASSVSADTQFTCPFSWSCTVLSTVRNSSWLVF
jgi:hypothetical protein